MTTKHDLQRENVPEVPSGFPVIDIVMMLIVILLCCVEF